MSMRPNANIKAASLKKAVATHGQSLVMSAVWAINAGLLFWAGQALQIHAGIEGAIWCMSSAEALPHCGFCYAAALAAAISLFCAARPVLTKVQKQRSF